MDGSGQKPKLLVSDEQLCDKFFIFVLHQDEGALAQLPRELFRLIQDFFLERVEVENETQTGNDHDKESKNEEKERYREREREIAT